MSEFVRVGDKIINLSAITDVHVGPINQAWLDVYFGNGKTKTRFEGDDAVALRLYLQARSVDVHTWIAEEGDKVEARHDGD